MAMKFTNNATTTLASTITSIATSLTVAGGDGALFPTLTASDYFYCTLANSSGTIEIIKVTARSTDTFTITRAQDNTVASAFTAGDKVELRLVAASLNDLPKLDEANTFSAANTFSTTLGITGVATFSAQPIFSSLTASSAVATDASRGLVSVTNTGTGNNVLATTPTIATPSISSPTISDGTANGVTYLNGSKVLTTGSALVFDGSNLGVGVTPSAWRNLFNVLQSGASSSFVGQTNSNTTYVASNWYTTSGGTDTRIAAGYASQYYQDSGQHVWRTAATSTAGSAISFTQAMTLDASGNLVVGATSSSSQAFRVSQTAFPAVPSGFYCSAGDGAGAYQYGITRVDGTNGRGFQFLSSLGAGNLPYYSISVGTAASTIAGMTFSEALRITSGGDLLVGATVIDPSTNAFTFQPSSKYGVFSHATGTSSGTVFTYFSYAGSAIGSVSQNGTTGVLYNLTSDYRLKNDQQALTGAKDFIMALKPKKWQWWDGSGEGVGFVAHEFMEVAKHSGHGEKDAVDADGKPKYQSIQPSSSEVMANLVSFIQEQQALITTLTARITALESA